MLYSISQVELVALNGRWHNETSNFFHDQYVRTRDTKSRKVSDLSYISSTNDSPANNEQRNSISHHSCGFGLERITTGFLLTIVHDSARINWNNLRVRPLCVHNFGGTGTDGNGGTLKQFVKNDARTCECNILRSCNCCSSYVKSVTRRRCS